MTSDNFNTSEQQLKLKADFEVDIGNGLISATTSVKGLNTVFEEAFFGRGTQEEMMGIAAMGVHWRNISGAFKMKLGAG